MADYNRTSVGTVIDDSTGLEWQDNYSDNNNSIKNLNWKEAIAYCESLILDGNNWRLPNIQELNSIVNLESYKPSIASVFENTTDQNDYWSSSTLVDDHSLAWTVSFNFGERASHHEKNNTYYIRCVRDRQ